MTIKCIYCGLEAQIMDLREVVVSDVWAGEPTHIRKTIHAECFNCGLEFELIGQKEMVDKWVEEHVGGEVAE